MAMRRSAGVGILVVAACSGDAAEDGGATSGVATEASMSGGSTDAPTGDAPTPMGWNGVPDDAPVLLVRE